MTILVVILIFNFLLNALMIYLLFISNPAGTINRFLGALLIPITLTNLEMLLFINTGDAPFVGLSLAMFGALFFFPMFYHFSFYFPRKQLSQKSRRTCLTFYIISFCLGLMLLSIIFIPWDKLTMQSFLSWEKTERLPLSLAIFFIGIFGFLVSLLTMTVVRFVSSLSLPLTERERTTVLMIVAGFVPISFVMIFNFFFFRSTSAGYWIYCATSVLHTIYFSVLTFRFGFVDRKRIFRIFVFFPANIGVIAVAYLYAFKPLNRWLSSIFPVNEAFFLGIELVIVSLLFSAVYRAVIRYVDKHFFSSLTNLHEAMIHTQEALDEVIDLDQFCQVLLRFFTGTLKVRTVQFFFLSDERFALYHPFGRSGDVSFSVNGELAAALRAQGRILHVQQIALSFTDKAELELLERFKSVLVVPLGTRKRLEGFILLGSDKSGIWDQSEIEELEIFSAGFLSVLERCRSHSRAIELEKKQARIEKTAVISELLGGIAHEIRNPLSIIAASAETICNGGLSEAEQKTCAGYIKEESERLSGILGKLLSSFSLAFEFEHSPVNVVSIVSRVLDFLRTKFDEKRISVFLSGPECVRAIIDKEALTQVCLNLLLNAQESLQKGGSISVTFSVTDGEDGKVFIDIHDSGEQIPKEIRKRIFDPFFTTRTNGTGLGLPISLRILRNAGGDLVLLPTEEGNTFRIILPKEK